MLEALKVLSEGGRAGAGAFLEGKGMGPGLGGSPQGLCQNPWGRFLP